MMQVYDYSKSSTVHSTVRTGKKRENFEIDKSVNVWLHMPTEMFQ